MTINSQMIQEFADRFFEGDLPDDLYTYLYDRYGEDPLHGDLYEGSLYAMVYHDVREYIAGTLDSRIRSPLEKLQDQFDELRDITSDFAEKCSNQEKEIYYMREFIQWMHLQDLYQDFCRKSHEEYNEDEPFGHLVM